mmetsp:Transcript_26519/g.78771  ORF Transcript_26519/g.78771 Transcript_26519/m.78771 type:complete len:264 (+) Transcript_26519:391-1182(+)
MLLVTPPHMASAAPSRMPPTALPCMASAAPPRVWPRMPPTAPQCMSSAAPPRTPLAEPLRTPRTAPFCMPWMFLPITLPAAPPCTPVSSNRTGGVCFATKLPAPPALPPPPSQLGHHDMAAPCKLSCKPLYMHVPSLFVNATCSASWPPSTLLPPPSLLPHPASGATRGAPPPHSEPPSPLFGRNHRRASPFVPSCAASCAAACEPPCVQSSSMRCAPSPLLLPSMNSYGMPWAVACSGAHLRTNAAAKHLGASPPAPGCKQP